jgi:hypothetical protein
VEEVFVKRFLIFVFCMGCGGSTQADDAGTDAAAGDVASDAGAFVTGVVSFEAGPCSGFGKSEMPQVVDGPPIGGGSSQGSTDVVSLGVGGSIVVSFAPNEIVNGVGPDFVVFENAFWVGGNQSNVYAEPGEVSVSDDGFTWFTYPCTANAGNPPYGKCAGTNPVFSPPASPTDYPACGGDAFDLEDLGLAHAKYVRIVDHSGETCTPPQMNAGFDLDAIVILHPQ